MIDYRIRPNEGFTEKIGELVSMLEYSRAVTFNEISNLSQSDLDYLPDDRSNSIGSLLLHMASIEFVHQIIAFEKRDLNEIEYLKWQVPLELGDRGRQEIKNKSLNYYIDLLSKVRENTLTLLKTKKDNWLMEEEKWESGVPFNNYYLWFHVMEDEISHRGQIRTLKRLLSK